MGTTKTLTVSSLSSLLGQDYRHGISHVILDTGQIIIPHVTVYRVNEINPQSIHRSKLQMREGNDAPPVRRFVCRGSVSKIVCPSSWASSQRSVTRTSPHTASVEISQICAQTGAVSNEIETPSQTNISCEDITPPLPRIARKCRAMPVRVFEGSWLVDLFRIEF